MVFDPSTPVPPAINTPRFNIIPDDSGVPPGIGRLNYLQTLLAGITDQAVYTTSQVTFASVVVTGLTASKLVGSSASKALQSIDAGVSLSLAGTTLNTIQDIRTTASPTFAGATIGSLTGILKAAAGVVAAATIGSSLSYSAPTLDAIQDIRTSASPTHVGLTLSGISTSGVVQAVSGVLSNCPVSSNLVWTAPSTTVSLLHFDGSDGSTTFTDETGKTWTAVGNAQIDTAQSVFGGASGLFDGTGDYIQTADTSDFDFGTGDFTIDFRLRPAAVSGWHGICSIGAWTNGVFIELNGTAVYVYINGTGFGFTPSPVLAANTWYHIALTRSGTSLRCFVDGTQAGTTQTSAHDIQVSGVSKIGTSVDGDINAWIDEFRILKGEAAWTAAFTPPASAYTSSTPGLDTVQDIQQTSNPTFNSLVCTNGFGCNGTAAQTEVTVDSASTDLPSVIALCNQIRTALIANGICV